MRNISELKLVVSVYGQIGYVDAERYNNPTRHIFPLHNSSGENIKLSYDQNEVVHRGNITNEYELIGDSLLVYTETHKVWEAYRRTYAFFPSPYVTSATTLSCLKQKLAAYDKYSQKTPKRGHQ